MRLSLPERNRNEEDLVPLINIVFLILIFFLIASTISSFSTRRIKLAETDAAANSQTSTRVIVIRSDGTRLSGNVPLSDEQIQARFEDWSKEPELPLTVVADRAIAADQLIAVVTQANAAGIKNVMLLTRRIR